MNGPVRRALQVAPFFLLLSLVIAIGSEQTGAVEKVALVAVVAALVWVASRVRRKVTPVRHA